eukprot:c16296_g1_i1.p1 GENE.c16296_g1_i1~~c16296_g1_i1.p1  ORF type:complete len:292 (-),score=14.61 c16296_g1_i1:31-906(-)
MRDWQCLPHFGLVVSHVISACLSVIFLLTITLLVTRGSTRLDNNFLTISETRTYSVVLLAGEHPLSTLKSAIRAHSRCKSFHSVIIVWDQDSPVPSTFKDSDVRVLTPTTPGPNGIYSIYDQLEANVFFIDPRSSVSCEDMDFAFSVFLMGNGQITGFEPSLVANDDGEIVEFGIDKVKQKGHYSFISLNGAFVSRTWLVQYMSTDNLSARALVDRKNSCEDVALHFYIHSQTNLPPRWVLAPSWHNGVPRFTSSKSLRHECFRAFIDQYAGVELPITSIRYQNILSTWYI